MIEPADWNGESYCMEDDCLNPATHSRLFGMIGEDLITEMVCCEHAYGTAEEE